MLSFQVGQVVSNDRPAAGPGPAAPGSESESVCVDNSWFLLPQLVAGSFTGSFTGSFPRSSFLSLRSESRSRMSAPRLNLEALSALSGCDVQPTTGPSQLSPQDFVNIVALKEFYKQQGFKQLEYPSLGTLSLQDLDTQDLYSSPGALTGGTPSAGPEDGSKATIRINPEDFFHPQYDYDFTSIKDGDKAFLRGDERYLRPCGWNRLGLRVTQRYEGGDSWLGTGKDAWPVSYHGQNMDGSLGIILTRGESAGEEPEFLDAAAASLVSGGTRGRGVYSTPDVATAEAHCKSFKSKVDGKTYKVVLQNRLNPEKRRRCQREDVWLVYVPMGHSHLQTRAVVQEAIRPYGLLLKEA
ncbi:uncharacterized protein LOC117739339 [Cyclopterus lumpus]|uniref:uncharacterized protein LOC117739339 n=1 Tax=Cyclopterus lumpus TaxID=8103 RepID=UPI001485E5D3|nr:uncharacterized protein LOC117739339 [Cyclopterus lumpus]